MHKNVVDPDQTPQNAASNLGLHCLLITLLRASALKQVKGPRIFFFFFFFFFFLSSFILYIENRLKVHGFFVLIFYFLYMSKSKILFYLKQSTRKCLLFLFLKVN